MRILVLGAGALGGYFGARLLAAGRDVTFLVRPARAEKLAAKGLHVISPHGGDLLIPHPPTILHQDLYEPYDLVLLSSKSYDLPSAMDAIAPAIGPGTLILPMLNGMAHMAQLDARFGPERVLGGTCFISAVLEGDGTIRHLNQRDGLFFGARGEAPMPDGVAGALLNANFMAAEREDVLQDMWEKWTFIASLAAMTCLMRATIGEIATAGGTPLVLALFRECIAIAEAEGHRPSNTFIAAHDEYLSQPGSSLHASMLRDLEAGSAIEAGQIVGDLLQRGERHRVPAPLLTVAFAHLRAYEVRRQQRA